MKYQFLVHLACGCSVRMRVSPANGHSKFACPGAGHGYSLPWTLFTDLTSDQVFTNRASGVTNREAVVAEHRATPGMAPVSFEDVQPGDFVAFLSMDSRGYALTPRSGVVRNVSDRSVSVYRDGRRYEIRKSRWAERMVLRRLPEGDQS